MAEKKSENEWEQNLTFQFRTSKDFLKLLDDWRRKQENLPSRAQAIRLLVKAGIEAEKRPRK
ncbi:MULTISPECIES: hypothetical protein [Bradyrhizobium]|uniref:Ribbon-helix-helix protein, CopG family n=2 Tax=Bradyrhizobium TaxID=374 RepID=A0ABY0QFC7_9BRAD|nr:MULTISPECIES: hypothetical protein [Bradyrhizobium]SDK15127.1 hypothetical protein SAMN05444163_7367 [Bradyrhizobium ottawaense]SEE50365.1 hypothetical protein SAMN05444171_7764 [Bradyrhizobium lablabi]